MDDLTVMAASVPGCRICGVVDHLDTSQGRLMIKDPKFSGFVTENMSKKEVHFRAPGISHNQSCPLDCQIIKYNFPLFKRRVTVHSYFKLVCICSAIKTNFRKLLTQFWC